MNPACIGAEKHEGETEQRLCTFQNVLVSIVLFGFVLFCFSGEAKAALAASPFPIFQGLSAVGGGHKSIVLRDGILSKSVFPSVKKRMFSARERELLCSATKVVWAFGPGIF